MKMMRTIGVVMLALAILGAFLGFQRAYPGPFSFADFFTVFYTDLSSELAGIAITVLIIDFLNERREQRRLRWQLVHELGSRNNEIADRAAYELRERGWLMDGTLENADLHNADLSGANLANANLCHANLLNVKLIGAELQNANLSETDLKGAILKDANLQNANLWASNVTAEQLNQAYSYEGATLPDGTIHQENRLTTA